MSIENTPEFQARLARARANVSQMVTLADDLRTKFPGQTGAWYSQQASTLVQLENQNANAAAQRRSWLSRLFG
jgi:hypothetical protein